MNYDDENLAWRTQNELEYERQKLLDKAFYDKENDYLAEYSKKVVSSAFGVTEADLNEGTYKVKTEHGPATLSPIMPVSKDEAYADEGWVDLKKVAQSVEYDTKAKEILGVKVEDLINKWDAYFEKSENKKFQASMGSPVVHGEGKPNVWAQLQTIYDKQITIPSPGAPLDTGYSIEARKAPKAEVKPKKPRYPAYKKNDRVNTPSGTGNVWSVDKDGTVCVELDSDPSILHEFEKKELKKIKK